MMALVDRALALNPNYARGWHVSGVLRLRAGQPDIAIEHGEAALRLRACLKSPRRQSSSGIDRFGVRQRPSSLGSGTASRCTETDLRRVRPGAHLGGDLPTCIK